MSIDTTVYTPLTAFMVGLLSSGHCLGMCGGISAALGMGIPVGTNYPLRRAIYLLTYNSGRLLSYAGAGALVAALSLTSVQWLNELTIVLRTLAGILLILMGLYISGWNTSLARTESFGRPLWRKVEPYARRLIPVRSVSTALLAGILWGWLPCGLVYASLGWAATQSSIVDAVLLMLAFGLGTLPSMLATGVFAGETLRWLQRPQFKRAVGLLIIALGVWTLPLSHSLIASLGSAN